MGKNASLSKTRSITFPLWMINAIEEIAKKHGFTATDVIQEFLRQKLETLGYTMGLGTEAVEDTSTSKLVVSKKDSA